MKAIRCLFIVVFSFFVSFIGTGCSGFMNVGLSTSRGYTPLCQGSVNSQLPKFGYQDGYGNPSLRPSSSYGQSYSFGKNEIIVVNSTGEIIDVLEGDRMCRADVETSQTVSLVCNVPYYGGNVDIPIIVNIYKMDANKKVQVGQVVKTFHFYGGRQERVQWVITGPKFNNNTVYGDRVIR
jgi:hypothetical protein